MFTVSIRRMQNPTSVKLNRYLEVMYEKFCDVKKIESVYGFVNEFNRFYGGRFHSRDVRYPELVEIEEYNKMGYGFYLPISNLYYEEKYYETLVALIKKIPKYGNNGVIVSNLKLANEIRRDFPNIIMKLSCIATEIDYQNKLQVEKLLKIFDYICILGKYSLDKAYLQSLTNKDRFIPFVNGICSWTCELNICYERFSRYHMYTDLSKTAKLKLKPFCSQSGIKKMNYISCSDDRFKGFKQFKLEVA